MARVLIIGCGDRGVALAGALRQDGHVVRGTTRDPSRLSALEAVGIDAVVADPNLLGTMLQALDGVTVVYWLLGSATGDLDLVDALHGDRLAAMLEKVVDTGVRGFVYEAAGTVGPDQLRRGQTELQRAHDTWRIPVTVITADPADRDGWLEDATAALQRLIAST